MDKVTLLVARFMFGVSVVGVAVSMGNPDLFLNLVMYSVVLLMTLGVLVAEFISRGDK